MNESRYNSVRNARIIGLVLIACGVLALVGQFFDITLGDIVWPFFIITPGVMLFIYSLFQPEGKGYAITGSIVIMLGALLFYQNLFDHWESWAYAWALVAPTAVGLGQMAYGLLKAKSALVRSGRQTVNTGIVMFVTGFIFFELILNISGFNFGFWGWGIALIVAGVVVLLRALRPG